MPAETIAPGVTGAPAGSPEDLASALTSFDKEAEAKAKKAKEVLADLKWDAWFAMTLAKVTMAKEDPKGKANGPPPLEIADVSPYTKNPQLSESINEATKKQWDFRELRLKMAREAQAQAAVRLQAEENQAEAELYRDTGDPETFLLGSGRG